MDNLMGNPRAYLENPVSGNAFFHEGDKFGLDFFIVEKNDPFFDYATFRALCQMGFDSVMDEYQGETKLGFREADAFQLIVQIVPLRRFAQKKKEE